MSRMPRAEVPVGRIREIEERDDHASDVNVSESERLISGLAGTAIATYGLRRGGLVGAGLTLLGGSLVYRAVTGHCSITASLGVSPPGKARAGFGRGLHRGIKVRSVATINRSPAECYQFWRDFENLPTFMTHLQSVTVDDPLRSHWIARAPLGATVGWDAEILVDRPNERISWRSLEGSDINNSGSVQFRPAPGNRGTEVLVEINYEPPAGRLGVSIAKLLGEEPEQQIREDLRRFKQIMEAGEIPTVEGQPSCRAE